MSPELPRFNQRFVNRLDTGTPEQQFVSNLGDVLYLTASNLRTVHETRAELTESLYHMDHSSPAVTVERALYHEAYTGMFETALIDAGLQEYVLSINGLKDAVTRLKGRNIAWVNEPGVSEGSSRMFDAYIGESLIGFYADAVSAPSLTLELVSQEGSREHVLDIASMRDIQIYPQL